MASKPRPLGRVAWQLFAAASFASCTASFEKVDDDGVDMGQDGGAGRVQNLTGGATGTGGGGMSTGGTGTGGAASGGVGTGGLLQPRTCGNGVIDPSEFCDGSNLNGETCESATLGAAPNGVLLCSGACSLDTSACRGAAGSGGASGAGGAPGIGGMTDAGLFCTATIGLCPENPFYITCCTPDDECGMKVYSSSVCYPVDAPGTPDARCPSETSSTWGTTEGCCLDDGRCGVQNPLFGCIAREESQTITALAGPYAAQCCDGTTACMPTGP